MDDRCDGYKKRKVKKQNVEKKPKKTFSFRSFTAFSAFSTSKYQIKTGSLANILMEKIKQQKTK